MGLKNLFTVGEDEKVTEKVLNRVLISSICSIMLCICCLAGTTWAWFMVDVENTGNVIRIGEPEIVLTVDDSAIPRGTQLPAGSRRMSIIHANELDDLQKKSTLYVTLILSHDGESTIVYTTLSQGNQYGTEITIESEKDYTLSWEVSWFAPVNAIELIDSTIYLPAEAPTESETSTEENTLPDEPAAVPETQEVTGSTEEETE